MIRLAQKNWGTFCPELFLALEQVCVSRVGGSGQRASGSSTSSSSDESLCPSAGGFYLHPAMRAARERAPFLRSYLLETEEVVAAMPGE